MGRRVQRGACLRLSRVSLSVRIWVSALGRHTLSEDKSRPHHASCATASVTAHVARTSRLTKNEETYPCQIRTPAPIPHKKLSGIKLPVVHAGR